MNKYTTEQVKKFKSDLINGRDRNKKGLFGIIYRDMLKYQLDPFGKDIDLFFQRVEILRDRLTKNPLIKKLHEEIS